MRCYLPANLPTRKSSPDAPVDPVLGSGNKKGKMHDWGRVTLSQVNP